MKKIILALLLVLVSTSFVYAKKPSDKANKPEKASKHDKRTVEEKIANKTTKIADLKTRRTKIQSRLDELNKVPEDKLTEVQKAKKVQLEQRLEVMSKNETKVNESIERLNKQKVEEAKSEKVKA